MPEVKRNPASARISIYNRTEEVTMLPAIATELVGEEALYEVIDGRRVEIAPMGIHEIWIASKLLVALENFASAQKFGSAVVEGIFDLTAVGTQRRPDIAC